MNWLLLLTFLVTAPLCRAWWCTGHMLVAQVAFESLPSSVLDEVAPFIAFMNEQGGYSADTNMVEAACWADDVKSDGMYLMDSWHFIDTPYNPQSRPNVPQPEKQNVAAVIKGCEQVFTNGKANTYEKAFALMNLIHFVGDIHQPLHASELYSSAFPSGDQGGNMFMVNYNGKSIKLHQFWDSMGESYINDPHRPLSSSDAASLKKDALSFIDEYQFSESVIANADPLSWAKESYTVAVNAAYDGITPSCTLSSSYIARAVNTSKAQVTLGGLRLARALQNLLGNSKQQK